MLARVTKLGEGHRQGVQSIDLPSPTVTASRAVHGGWSSQGLLEILVEPWEDPDLVKMRAQRSGAMTQFDDVTDRPMTTITAAGHSDVLLTNEQHVSKPRQTKKPPYAVPTIKSVRRRKKGKPTVVSTFSGCGGSSLGYRMAGFTVDTAVEIAAVPCATYRRNFPDTTVIERSIRDVTAADLPKDIDLFDGSPPCTSFSTAGLRAKTWGQERQHAGVKQRIDDLFFDYARLIEETQPRVLVAENVSGLYKGAAIGYFKAVLRVLRQCGYVVACQLLDADKLGVPQHRERVFFIGVRQDIADQLGLDVDGIHDQLFPKPLPYQYTVRDALPWLDPASDAYTLQGTPFGTPERIANGRATPPLRVKGADEAPAATITTGQRSGVQVPHDRRRPGIEEEDVLDRESPTIVASAKNATDSMVQVIHDPKGMHPAMGDVIDREVPTLRTTDQSQFHVVWREIESDDGGTVYRRKFTIPEIRRLCSFPDDFDLEGKFHEQWAQCGNSVPPLMMRAIAERLRDRVFKKIGRW